MATFVVQHQCPQCAAPLSLGETDRLVRCAYCRVVSYMVAPGFFRYILDHPATDDPEVFYVPYWRFKGVLFSSSAQGVKSRFMDVSHQAIRCDAFPASLGFRSQALRLKIATPEIPGRFLEPTFPLEDAMEIFQRRFSKDLPRPVFHQDFIGETLSLVYSPYRKKDRIVDAILDKPLSGRSSVKFDPARPPGGPPKGELRFLPALCPDCGWDLDGRKDSLALICRNCRVVWIAKGNRFGRIKFETLELSGDVFLPFWRIKASVKGADLSTRADLVRIANLPRPPTEEDRDADFHFWVAAFKVPPRTFIRINRNLTLSQPGGGMEGEFPRGEAFCANLPVSEAADSVKLNFAEFARPAERYLPDLPNIRIQPISARMVFIAFRESSHELVQNKFHLTVNKNQLGLASNL